MFFVPDIFALKRTNDTEEISLYSDFDRWVTKIGYPTRLHRSQRFSSRSV